MSGIEAVGITLGTISLIISLLEHYGDGQSVASTWRRHARVLKSLRRDLMTERGRLYNTCELLLGGVVLPAKLEPMLKEPFGPLWQDEDTQAKVKRRLDHMYDSFQETVKDILGIIEELESRLGLGSQDKSDRSMSAITKRYLTRASLVINRSSYQGALEKLESKNGTLQGIIIDSLRLEPSRRQRSRKNYLNLFRKIIGSMYKALRLGLCEACSQGHGVSLELLTPRLSFRADDATIIDKLYFHAILSHHAAGLVGRYSQSLNWKEVKVQAVVPSATVKDRVSVSTHTPAPEIGDTKVAKRVTILMDGATQSTSHPGVGKVSQSAKNLQVSKAKGLCQVLIKRSLGPKTCGYMTDPSAHEYGRFSVSTIDHIHDSCDLTFLSIEGAIRLGYRHRRNTPSLPQKLNLASTISSGILQLYNTPWLSTAVTSDTLYLASFDNKVSFDRAYMLKAMPEHPCRHHPVCPQPCEGSTSVIPSGRLGNDLMWSLFVLLIEVILWRDMDVLLCDIVTLPGVGRPPREIFDYTTKKGFDIVEALSNRVNMAGGEEYCRAVRTCLKLASGYPDLDLSLEEVQQQLCDEVVALIEESCENSKSLIVAGDLVDLEF
ncbi:hypothetical protein F4777DRAFT_582715 [Nemania sp. FL0916]|nr:hypothetical protein F4777DRAFT_582715 [Nemania sp. FL0916]